MDNPGDTLPVKNLKSLLQQSLDEKFEIKDINWKYLTDPGENFGSLIFAIDVTIERSSKTELLHVIAKLPPPSPFLVELFSSPFTFKKEIALYKGLMPEFFKLQRECGIFDPESSWIGARYYGSRMGLKETNEFDDQACIILENLNYSGYKMANRLVGLNREQTEFAVKKLAELHAVTIALKLLKPKVFQNLAMPALESSVNRVAMENNSMEVIVKTIEKLQSVEETKPYLGLIVASVEKAREMRNAHKVDETWCTLVHNDFWLNNIMYRVNENNDITGMKIVDFQLCAYDYGIKDLIFFLISSPANEIIDTIFDDMIDTYYNSFIVALSLLNVDISKFTKDKYMELVKFCIPLKLEQCILMTHIIKGKPGTAPKMDTIDNTDALMKLACGDAYINKLLLMMKLYHKRNWLLTSK